jgi:hypothetical protein
MDEAVVVSTPSEAPTAAPEDPVSTVIPDRRDAIVPEGDAPEIPPVDGEAKPEEKHEPVPKGVQKRIDRAVRDKYEAQARTKMLEERLAQLEQRQPAPAAAARAPDGAPTIDQFNNFDEYVTAKADFIAKRTIEQTMGERDQRQAMERQATSQAKLDVEWNKRIEKATALLPDFEEVVSTSEAPMTDPMKAAIKESDLGPQLAYYLANNPDEAVAIADMTPLRAVSALGRLEERLSKPAEKKTTSAPAPIPPSGGKARVAKDPGDMSMDEFTRWRKSVIKAR